jgi:hypothetical protein
MQIKELRGLNPQANYTDRATAKLVPTFAYRGCLVYEKQKSLMPLAHYKA